MNNGLVSNPKELNGLTLSLDGLQDIHERILFFIDNSCLGSMRSTSRKWQELVKERWDELYKDKVVSFQQVWHAKNETHRSGVKIKYQGAHVMNFQRFYGGEHVFVWAKTSPAGPNQHTGIMYSWDDWKTVCVDPGHWDNMSNGEDWWVFKLRLDNIGYSFGRRIGPYGVRCLLEKTLKFAVFVQLHADIAYFTSRPQQAIPKFPAALWDNNNNHNYELIPVKLHWENSLS